MRMHEKCALLATLVMVFGSAAASEYKITPIGNESSERYISVVCANGNISFAIQWNTKIGRVGKYRRHLVLPGALGDTHILLKVLSDRTRTGIIDSDLQAKSLIKLIRQSIKTDYMSIQVFPEGRDLGTGQWERIGYKYDEFQETTNAAAKECNWDINSPIDAVVCTVNPGAPYDDE